MALDPRDPLTPLTGMDHAPRASRVAGFRSSHASVVAGRSVAAPARREFVVELPEAFE
jgi:hypothetical protein